MDRFDVAVLIGSFQPFHRVNRALLERALSSAPVVVVVIGSARHAPTAKNPFSAPERERMIRATVSEAEQARLRFVALPDFYDEAAWCEAVKASVAAQAPAGARCALVGGVQEASSHSVRRLSAWHFLGVEAEPGV
ncbi:MAG TPA: adenylyltransferase/cytidyltransferase family protein, partial [Polyangiales bacterium]|nr:adenylyltransferase/cytidyltransferase family protein [Polyangiales bacterium]